MSDSPIKHNSRRQFLHKSAVAAGTAVAASAAGTPPAVHAAGSDLLKLGLVGCGGRGTGAAGNALRADSNTQLVAVADAFPEKAERCLKNLRNETDIADRIQVDDDHLFVGLDAYQNVIDSVDVVLLCTPPGFRPLHLRAAVESGRHIFTEKPMATDSMGVRSVIETVQLAKEKNLALLAGFCWRYSSPKRMLFEKIHNGEIGDVRAVFGTYLTGPVKPMPPASSRPQGMSDLEWMVRNWYNFTWLSGDGLVEQACHTVDWIAWAMGDTRPVSCTAVGGRQIPAEGGDIYDHVEINYLWENGARCFLAQRQIPGCHGENNLYVMGTKGNASLARGSYITDLNGKQTWKYRGPNPDMYEVEHQALFSSIRSGQPINHGDRMVNSTLMAIMGRTAGYTGQMLTWEEALNASESLTPDIKDWNSPVTFRDVPLPGNIV